LSEIDARKRREASEVFLQLDQLDRIQVPALDPTGRPRVFVSRKQSSVNMALVRLLRGSCERKSWLKEGAAVFGEFVDELPDWNKFKPFSSALFPRFLPDVALSRSAIVSVAALSLVSGFCRRSPRQPQISLSPCSEILFVPFR